MPGFFAFVDVSYAEHHAAAAAVITWSQAPHETAKTYIVFVAKACRYIPGNFYRREMPCILKVLEEAREPIDTVFVDAYARLPDGRPGLGARLFSALGGKIPVIGIAKNHFITAESRDVVKRVFRGKSERPLYVSVEGIGLECAAKLVSGLPGPYRIPYPMKAAHRLSKKAATSLDIKEIE